MSVPAAIIAPMLKRSNDRKVANLVAKNGKTPAIANTFGLPAGKAFSCPGATSICESVCYAGKLEKLYKGVKNVLMHNWNLLKDADHDTMVDLLGNMINDFRKDCEKKNAKLLFRIHWDGDFFNDTYAIPSSIENLSLYYSTDDENKDIAHDLRKTGTKIRLAYLGKTFAVTENTMKELIGKPGAKCPENNKQIPLISANGSACVSCGLCVYGKADIRFSASKK
jgi:ferredoxin